ncbi:elongator complex protein 5-like [Tubulanus polymorphus]|uniref:elongator complex protein 5-like n=1 Tax=Tubulanus polymorphus TaxID=672921 RepID=UPI003DA56492
MERIIDLKEHWKSSILHDSLDQNGRDFLGACVRRLADNDRIDRIHVLCYENSTKQHLTSRCDKLNKITFHDFTKDPLGWEGTGGRNVNTNLETFLRDNHHSSPCEKHVVIVFDCLEMLLLNRPVAFTCRTIHNLSHNKFHSGIDECRVLALMHDLHDDATINAVDHVFSTVFRIRPSPWPSHTHCCHTTLKKLSGKVIKTIEHFSISEVNEIIGIATEESIAAIKNTVDVANLKSAKPTDPMANLTFNLKLTENEKTARSQVKLPYMHDTKIQEVTLHRSVGDGKIFYQPDEVDDFDEDDPDDDLDI